MKLFLCPNLIFTSRAIAPSVACLFRKRFSACLVSNTGAISDLDFEQAISFFKYWYSIQSIGQYLGAKKKRNLTDLCITYLCQGNHQLGASGVREICQPHPTTFRKQKSNKRFTRSFMKSMLCPQVNHTEGVSFEMMISCKPYELILRQYCMAHHSKKIEM